MENHKEVTNIEHRAFAGGMELRQGEGGGMTLRGYAARFGSIYDMGWFTEEVDVKAFDKANMEDVRILLNHDSNQILGRTKSGTARVGIDKEGFWYEVDMDANSPNAQNVLSAISRGDIDQSSWGFSIVPRGDSWSKRDGKDHRVLEQVSTVYDASPVTFPANPDTTVAKRSKSMLEARDDEMEIPDLSDIQASIIDSSTDCIDDLNEALECCEDCVEMAEQYAGVDPGNADLYNRMATDCQAVVDACKVAIQTHTEIVAAVNGQRSGEIIHKSTGYKEDFMDFILW